MDCACADAGIRLGAAAIRRRSTLSQPIAKKGFSPGAMMMCASPAKILAVPSATRWLRDSHEC
jgi:hypothetical protein